ncbi:hypothetical protein MMC14_004784 [Varicellaria rhodocarpa]|nr:hypothetical protein [Varicellaria rhodocarpa]
MEALTSFTFLSENLPLWISELNQLSAQVAERRAEFVRLSKSPTSINRKRKTGSTESLRPNDATENDNALLKTPPQVVHIDINPDNKHLFREVREAHRKRRSGSILSGASGPRKYRNRLTMIIYYDSAIQEGFETLVRNIGSARNSLKKGKQHASFKARMQTLRMEEVPSASGGKLRHPVGQIGQSNISKTRDNSLSPGSFGIEAFDKIDKDLEAAQSLCELGAHQFLRDGDCSDEVEGVKERFENSLRVSKEQVSLLSIERQREMEREEQSDQISTKYPRRGSATSTRQPYDVQVASEGSVRTDLGNMDETPMAIDSFPAVGAIEVDDESDAGSVHIDLSAFRSARRSWKKG